MAGQDTSQKAARAPGPELRLLDRRAFVGFPELKLSAGLVITDFALSIPDVSFPLNVSGGAARYQKKKLDFGFLELTVDADVLHRALTDAAGKLGEVDDLRLFFRPGVLEAQARLRGPDRAPVTFKVAFDGDGERLAVYFYDVRLYGFSTTPAARVPALLTEAVSALSLLPDVERRGASGFSARILPQLVEQAAVARGYKMPALDQARLAEATVSSKGLKLRFSSGGLPPPAGPDEELLLALEGARAFADAEDLLARGKLKEARQAYLRLGDAAEAHPFAVERLLTILVADPPAHELALDIAASLGKRRERSATALWAEAVVRERRGEFARAAERYLALCTLARRNQEDASAFFAAEAAARASRDHAPQMAVKALHELLGLKPDHLPSLKALARASDQAQDRAGAIRAYRRLAALARDSAEAADAHVQLARLCALTEDDLAGARLHCEAALRLAPDHPDALLQLGELCFRSDEPLRAIKALDRLRDVAMGRHEVDRVGKANLLAGQVWELGLKQPENALLRYREAASLLPGEAEPLFYAARVAEALGKVQEAVADYAQAIELAGPAPRTEAVKTVAHQAHHALARLLKTKLGEPARAREHLEAALALSPTDALALAELLPYFRASGKAAELADACEKAAATLDDPRRRAALWAEAGELYRGRLAQPERAERLLSQAVEADGTNRLALEGLLALAESRRDGGQLARCLRALAELAEDPKERVRYYRRLAVAARDLCFDLELAAHAFREVLKVEADDLPGLGELVALERRRGDMPGLASALEARARAAETHGDKRHAAAVLRELSQVYEQRLGRSGEALVSLEKSVRLVPDVSTLLELANLSLRLERPLNARRALEEVLAALPRHAPPERLAEVRARLGRACEQLGDKDAARQHYAQAFPLRRLDDELAQRLEALYREADLTRELTELWASRAQALVQAGRSQDAAGLFAKSAQHLLSVGDASGALLRLTAALDAAPTGPQAAEALETLAQLELDRGQPLEAARLYGRRAELALAPREASRWFFRAAQLTRATAPEAAFLAASLERDPSFVSARLRRAELTEVERPKEALADLEAALAADPADPDVAAAALDPLSLHRRAGFAALKASQLDAARTHLSLYTAERPADLEAQLELVALHRRAGALEPLVDLLGEVWPRLEGTSRAQARREFAEGALTLGRAAAAVAALRSILGEEEGDEWAATRLLSLLPADEAHAAERATLVTRLLETATGEAKGELLARRAELHRLSGDLVAARADLLAAAQASTRPVPLLRALAELARQSGDDAAELGAWRLALEQGGRDQGLVAEAGQRLSAIAKARGDAGDQPRALEAWELAAGLPLEGEERFLACFGLAQAALAQGDARRAEAALLEASRQGPAPRRVEALLERAALLESRTARQDAAAAYQAALALSPSHPVASQGLKRNLRALEDFEGLAEVLAAEAAHAPRARAAPLFLELAALYLDKLQQPLPAEAALRQVVALDEGDVEARRKLARLLVQRGELPEATRLIEEAAEQLPPDAAAPLLREGAALANRAGDAQLELKLMRRAHHLSPAQGEDLARLAEALYLHGALDEALPLQQALVRAVSFEELPEVAEAAWLRLADLAEQTGDAPQAEAALRRVVQERPLNLPAVERLAAVLMGRDQRGALELLARHAEASARSPRTAQRLLELGRQVHAVLGDVAMAHRLLRRAAEASDEPLPLRRELVGLLRAAGRPDELRVELLELAQLALAAGDVDGALGAYQEEAGLAEGAGRTDEALRTLTAMAEVCEDEGRTEDAARYLVRRGELLRDTKLDLDGAEKALARAWELSPAPATARAAMELARRRGDRPAEIDWLERVLGSLTEPQAQAQAYLELARLHLGLPAHGGALAADAPLLAPDQAEAALGQALRAVPGLPEAEALLLALLERQDRPGDLAAHFEEAATRLRSGPARAQLLLRAAQLYQDRAGRPAEAAAALLAARAADPDDLALTARVADALDALGRRQDAADFDALLLEADPFHRVFERHRAHLEGQHDPQAVAALLSRRAQALEGPEAAQVWLEAGAAFRRAGALERAQVCEAQAFEASPASPEAFEALLGRTEGDVRRRAELLAARAHAVPAEAKALLRQRAALLTEAGEPLVAAGAWDEYLEQAPDDLSALQTRGELAAAAGGARAAQPYDRKLVQLGGAALPSALRLKVWTRLGLAATEAGAWRDAVDAFEEAFALDEGGPKGREALSHLSEAYARLHDTDGQYRSALRLARLAQGAEAESLLRRAVALYEDPAKAADALDALLPLHPGDEALYEKGRRAYRALGRADELAALHERFAAAVGGARGAQALLDAAQVVAEAPAQAERAFQLRAAAAQMDPDNAEAARSVREELRRRGDGPGLVAHLEAVVARGGEEADGLRLELAALLEEQGALERARDVLAVLRRAGPSGAGYAQAVAALRRVLTALGDSGGLAEVQLAAAELATTSERAGQLLEAARTFARSGALDRAEATVRSALAVSPTREGFSLLVELAQAEGDQEKTARALGQLADASEAKERGPLLFEAARAWEAHGAQADALAALERALKEAPRLVEPPEAAAWLLRLGAAQRALEVGFEPAMEAGRFEEALALADAALDAGRAAKALWAQAEAAPTSPAAARLEAELAQAEDVPGLAKLAQATLAAGQGAAAKARWARLLFEFHHPEALDVLAAAGALEEVAEEAAARGDGATLSLLLPRAPAMAPAAREALLAAVAAHLPERRGAALRALASLRVEAGRYAEAAEALAALAEGESEAGARAALQVERGELYSKRLGDPVRARAAFELALEEDPGHAAAMQELMELYQRDEPERFVAMAERLEALSGTAAIEPWREALADAYEGLGREQDAYRLLTGLEETPVVIARRAGLAERLGLHGEALSLREVVARPQELESILEGYLRLDLVPFAVRLGGRLLAEERLSGPTLRLLAERLSPTAQGAALAAGAWPSLLRAQPNDPDGWTSFSEALRLLGREEAAALADGFGAAQTSSATAAPLVAARALAFPRTGAFGPAPTALHPIDATTMPRLAAALDEAKAGFGAAEVRLALDVEGGVEAWMASADLLVLGAGALAAFGQSELSFLVALALALGPAGRALGAPGDVPQLTEAAVKAFEAWPSSLAAGRVLAQLDGRVRGGDPSQVDVAALLRDSSALRAVALRALELLAP